MSANHYFQSVEGIDTKNLQLTGVSIYSSTPWKEANFISRTILNFYGRSGNLYSISDEGIVITDATANVGGNTISFYLNGFKSVNAVEIDEETCSILKQNMTTYSLPTANTICSDYTIVYSSLKQDVIFIDPPWGGQTYDKVGSLDLYLSGIDVVDICQQVINKRLASLIVLKVPCNYNYQHLETTLKSKNFMTHEIYRGEHHSYNVIFIW